MAKAVQTSQEQREAFADALRSYLRRASMSQADLERQLRAEGFQFTQSAMSQWANGKNEPSRPIVEVMEQKLNLVPGLLSRHLGWLPLSAIPTTDVETAILSDRLLTADQRQVLVSTYRALIGLDPRL